MLSDQPQGGFITRKPTPPDILIAGPNDDSFNPFFQPSWNSQPVNTRRRGAQDYQPFQPRWW